MRKREGGGGGGGGRGQGGAGIPAVEVGTGRGAPTARRQAEADSAWKSSSVPRGEAHTPPIVEQRADARPVRPRRAACSRRGDGACPAHPSPAAAHSGPRASQGGWAVGTLEDGCRVSIARKSLSSSALSLASSLSSKTWAG